MHDIPDVDIEVANRKEVAALFPEAVAGSQIANRELVPHNSGLYFQKIPVNPLNGLAAFPYKVAEELGYYKLDLLKLTYPYDGIETMGELRDLIESPIDWSWFQDASFVSQLFHFGGEFDKHHSMGDIVAAYGPESIPDLACMVAIKMPAKRYLVGESWETVREQIWEREPSGREQFKKSHATAYAIVAALHARRLAAAIVAALLTSADHGAR